MNRLKIKICGMKEAGNISDVANAEPDYMGFIFYPKSPRFVGEKFTVRLPAGIEPVGVFVNESNENILKFLAQINSTTVQLHGSESPEQCLELRKRGVTVIKVFSVDSEFNFDNVKEYRTVTDFFLFDTRGKLYGGNAVAFDWNKLKEYNQSVPFFLSGGLNEENTNDLSVLEGMNVIGLDFNSGVEITPGVKNVEKVKSLVQARRITNNE